MDSEAARSQRACLVCTDCMMKKKLNKSVEPTATSALRLRTHLRRAVLVFALVAGLTGCAKKEQRVQLSEEAFNKLVLPGPAAGRAEFVSPVELIPDPAKYHGKRVILSGIWTAGFEHSMLDLENTAQDFWIWVDADWSKIDQPLGDFSRRKEDEGEETFDKNGYLAHRIVAEGTFYYRKADLKAGIYGFGHMSVSDGYFLIDRLFEFERYEKKKPNQAPEPKP